MTRERDREKCIKAMARAFCADTHLACTFPDCGCKSMAHRAASALDSLNGIACVVPAGATEEMIIASRAARQMHKDLSLPALLDDVIWRAMSAAGDLTNDPDAGLPTAADVRGILKPEEKP